MCSSIIKNRNICNYIYTISHYGPISTNQQVAQLEHLKKE